jgi:hypothetical protein
MYHQALIFQRHIPGHVDLQQLQYSCQNVGVGSLVRICLSVVALQARIAIPQQQVLKT